MVLSNCEKQGQLAWSRVGKMTMGWRPEVLWITKEEFHCLLKGLWKKNEGVLLTKITGRMLRPWWWWLSSNTRM